MVYLKSQLFIFSHSLILSLFFFWTHVQIDNREKKKFGSFIVNRLAFFVPLSLRVMCLFITEGVL